MVLCHCGKEATYQCTGCNPAFLICLTCIPNHLSSNSDDCIKPIKSRQIGLNICESCGTEKAVKLGVFDSCSKRLCKLCKASADLCIDLKWSSFVTKYSDLDQLSLRKAALARVNRELDESLGKSSVLVDLEAFKQDCFAALNEGFLEKAQEFKSFSSKHDAWVGRVRKEVNEQSFKKEIDLSTEGGRLLNALLNNLKYDLSAGVPAVVYPELKDLKSSLSSFLSMIKLADCHPTEKAVYLFSPGKNVLIKISLEELKKTEATFDKSWNFEASWIQLESKELFFCGGNGRDNSEVLLVNMNTRTLKNLQSFNGRSGHTLSQINNEIFVFGGNKGNYTEKYQFANDSWTVLAAIPCKIPRASSCVSGQGVIITGAETERFFLYDLAENNYSSLDLVLTGYNLKNKIIFLHGDSLVCLTGDKIFVQKNYLSADPPELIEYRAMDRDWWSYSAPVIHGNCAYFIKYFVRNLWCLNLETFKLTEIGLSTIN